MTNSNQTPEWTEEMATGIATIDKQHQYLFDTLQEARRKLLGGDNDILLNQIAKDLLGYAIMHFEAEEALMQRYGYSTTYPDEAKTHIGQHRDFSRQVVAIRDRLLEGQKVSGDEVLKFLNHWFEQHLLVIDQLFCDYLLQRTGGQDPLSK